MRIQTLTGKDFILPTEFYPEQTMCSEMLGSKGEQTEPLTLPGIPENMELIGWSDRLDTVYLPISDLTVIVSDGIISRSCNMGIHSANEIDGISCTLYFSSSSFYSLIDEKKLIALAWPVLGIGNINNLVTLLKSEYSNPTNDAIFGVCPLATTREYSLKWGGTEPIKGLFILNGFERVKNEIDLTADAPTLDKFEGEYTQIHIENDVETAVAIGYGMTPFLKLRFILETIFTAFGYTVDMSKIIDLYSIYENDMLVVNNVADALYSGKIYCRQLVPNVTIKEFVLEIEKSFAGKFVFNEVTKVATLCPYKNSVTETTPVDLDLTPYLVSPLKKGSREYSSIRVVNANDKAPAPASDKVEDITFTLVPEVTIEDTYYAKEYATHLPLSIKLKMLQIEDVVHLNSTVIIDGKATSENADTSSKIQLLQRKFNNGRDDVQCNWNTVYYKKIYYKTSHLAFSGIINTSPMTYLTNIYSNYKYFRQSSNIPVEGEMDIPKSLIFNLDRTKPKLVGSQRLLIESIQYSLKPNTKCKVAFRTIRQYSAR